MGISGADAPAHHLTNVSAHLFVALASCCFAGRINGRNCHDRSVGMPLPQDANKRIIHLRQRVQVGIVLSTVQYEGGRIDLRYRPREAGLTLAIAGEAQVDVVEIQQAPEDGLVAHSRTACASPLRDGSAVEDQGCRYGKRSRELERCILVQADLHYLNGTVERQVNGYLANYPRLALEIDVLVYLTWSGILVRHGGAPVCVADVKVNAALSERV